MEFLVRNGISLAAEAVTGSQVWVPIVQPTETEFVEGVSGYYTHHLTTLFCKVEVQSLTGVAAPEFPIDATPSERLRIIQEHEWQHSDRFELEIGLQPEGFTSPFTIFRASAMNQLGAPFFTINLMAGLGSAGDFILGEQDSLFARVVEVGFGNPVPNQDSLIVYGCAIREAWKVPNNDLIEGESGIMLINRVENTESQTITLTAGQQHIINPRAARKGMKIASWSVGSQVKIAESTNINAEGVPLMGLGSYYEMNASRLWTGQVIITAISDSVITIQEDW